MAGGSPTEGPETGRAADSSQKSDSSQEIVRSGPESQGPVGNEADGNERPCSPNKGTGTRPTTMSSTARGGDPDLALEAGGADHQTLAILCSRVGLVLFAVFLSMLVSTALPVRLFDPGWQWRMVNAVINQAYLPLLGLTLVWLSANLQPALGRLKARRLRLAGLSVAVAYGFVLLIPVQAVALASGLDSIRAADQMRFQEARAQMTQVRRAVLEAATVAELQQRLRQLKVPALRSIDGSRSLDRLRPQLIGAISTAEATLSQRRSALPADRLWALIQDSLRITASCLAYALGFAACGRRRGRRSSELDGWIRSWQHLIRSRRSRSGWNAGP